MLPDPLSLAETPQLKNVTSIEVHGFGYDLKVGGYVFDRAVRDLLVEAFEETTGKPLEEGRKFTDDKRAMAKLLKEAAHVKQVLSAKTAAMARETREHLLIACPLYDEARKSLFKHIRLRKNPTAGQLLGNPSYRDALLDFLDGTGRFPRLSRSPEVEKQEKERRLANHHHAPLPRQFRHLLQEDPYPAQNIRLLTRLFLRPHLLFRRSAIRPPLLRPLEGYLSRYRQPRGQAKRLVNATVRVGVQLDASGLLRVGKAEHVLREEEEGEGGKKGGVTDKLKGLFDKFSGKNSTASSSSSAPTAEGTATPEEGLTDEEKEQLDEMIRQLQLPPAKGRLTVETQGGEGAAGMGLEEKMELKKRLRNARTALTRKLAHEEARNALESYVYRVRNLLENNQAFVAASVESERRAVREVQERTAEKLVKHILSCLTEAVARPAAVSSLRDQLAKTTTFLSTTRPDSAALTKSDPSAPQRFTADKLDSLNKLVKESQAWLDDALKRQEKLKVHEDPAFKVAEVGKKLKEVERETSRLEKKKQPRRKKAIKATPAAAVQEEEEAQEKPKQEHKKDEL
ncbi:lumenal Hsp70 protein [Rhodotorula toruloides]